MLLKLYKTKEDYEKGREEKVIEGSLEDLSDVAAESTGWYGSMICYEDDDNTVFSEYLPGEKRIYFSFKYLCYLSSLIKHIIELVGTKEGNNCSCGISVIHPGILGLAVRDESSRDINSYAVRVDNTEEWLLTKVNEYLSMLGYREFNGIFFNISSSLEVKLAYISSKSDDDNDINIYLITS